MSPSESLVMEVLWESAPRSSQEIVAALAESQGWARSTTITLLQRLVKKGEVIAEGEGKSFRYSPAVGRDECATAEAKGVLERWFGGALHPLVAHFAKHGRLTKKDVTQLKALLNKMES